MRNESRVYRVDLERYRSDGPEEQFVGDEALLPYSSHWNGVMAEGQLAGKADV